jgi:hypothetical protein
MRLGRGDEPNPARHPVATPELARAPVSIGSGWSLAPMIAAGYRFIEIETLPVACSRWKP